MRRTRLLSLKGLRTYPEPTGMRLLAKRNRLSVVPAELADWAFIWNRLRTS